MLRDQVYRLIDGEREYQQSKWSGHRHGAGAYLSFLDHYLRTAIDIDAKEDADGEKHYQGAKGAIRKFAALCVAAMEENGVVYRTYEGLWRGLWNWVMRRGSDLIFRAGPVSRAQVYLALDQEREYQELTWPGPGALEFSEELTIMRDYLRMADDAWTSSHGDEEGLDYLRILAAIAVRSLETYGAPARFKAAA
jgi:hypothetical protein